MLGKEHAHTIAELIVAHNVFVEDRKPPVSVIGITLLYLGLSFRQAAEALVLR
jgi:hypothetical protein